MGTASSTSLPATAAAASTWSSTPADRLNPARHGPGGRDAPVRPPTNRSGRHHMLTHVKVVPAAYGFPIRMGSVLVSNVKGPTPLALEIVIESSRTTVGLLQG